MSTLMMRTCSRCVSLVRGSVICVFAHALSLAIKGRHYEYMISLVLCCTLGVSGLSQSIDLHATAVPSFLLG